MKTKDSIIIIFMLIISFAFIIIQSKIILSVYYFKTGRGLSENTDQYYQLVEKAYKLDPDNGYYSLLLSRKLMAQKKYEDALIYAEKGLRSYSSVKTFSQIGSIQWNLNKKNDSVKNFEKTLFLYNDEIDTRLRLAVLEIQNENLNRAKEHFEYVMKIAPENPNSYYFLGYIENELSNKSLALDYFDKTAILIKEQRYSLLFDYRYFIEVYNNMKEDFVK